MRRGPAVAEYVNYVTPVAGVKRILAKRDPQLGKNKLIFPTKKSTAKCTYEPALDGTQGRESPRTSTKS